MDDFNRNIGTSMSESSRAASERKHDTAKTTTRAFPLSNPTIAKPSLQVLHNRTFLGEDFAETAALATSKTTINSSRQQIRQPPAKMAKEATQKSGIAVGLNKGHVSCLQPPDERRLEALWTGRGVLFPVVLASDSLVEKNSRSPFNTVRPSSCWM